VSDDSIDLSFDAARLDVAAIHGFLSTQAYWSMGVPRDVVERAIANSLCIGAYRERDQVGFARVVTDRATFAYLADVFVVTSARGQGIARRMVGTLLAHDDLASLRRVLLFTADAHPLYRGLGFAALAKPERGMEILRPDVYESASSA
jgi:GNAT superfamily N-acetyltransferase